MGAHGDLQAVFDGDPPQEILDEMQDVDDVLAGDMWDGADYVEALRRRRGSRSVSEFSRDGVVGGGRGRRTWLELSQGGVGAGMGIRRRSTRDELVGTDLETTDA